MVAQAVIVETQAYLTRMGFLEEFIPPPHPNPDTVPPSLVPPGKERAHGDQGSEQQATFEKSKMLAGQMKAWAFPKSGCHLH